MVFRHVIVRVTHGFLASIVTFSGIPFGFLAFFVDFYKCFPIFLRLSIFLTS